MKTCKPFDMVEWKKNKIIKNIFFGGWKLGNV